MKRGQGLSLLAAGCLLALGAAVKADEPPPWHPWRLREWPGRLYQGRGNRVHTMERAGYPNEISRFAHPTDTGRYYGYYVGGGALQHRVERAEYDAHSTLAPGGVRPRFHWAHS